MALDRLPTGLLEELCARAACGPRQVTRVRRGLAVRPGVREAVLAAARDLGVIELIEPSRSAPLSDLLREVRK